MRTAHGSSPLQLYTLGMVTLYKDKIVFDHFTPIDDDYGVDENSYFVQTVFKLMYQILCR